MVSPSNSGSPRRARTSPPTSASHHVQHVVAIEVRAATRDVRVLEPLDARRRLPLGGRAVACRIGELGGKARFRGVGSRLASELARADGGRLDGVEDRGAHAVRFERLRARRRSFRPATSPRRGATRGSSPVSSSSVAAPSSVWQTSAAAVARGKPTSTPASVMASANRNTYAGPEPESPVTASRWTSGTRTTVPTAPSTRSARSRCESSARVPGRDRGGALADERARVGHRADDRSLAGPGFDVGERDPGRDRQHERVLRKDRDAGFERAGDVAGLDRDHHDVGVGRRPGRARDDAHPGKSLFEDPAALGVDLGDRDRVALPARVEQPLHQGLAHPTATEEREVSQRQAKRLVGAGVSLSVARRGRTGRPWTRWTRGGPEEPSRRPALPRTE